MQSPPYNFLLPLPVSLSAQKSLTCCTSHVVCKAGQYKMNGVDEGGRGRGGARELEE